MPCCPQSIGNVPCYAFDSHGLLLCPALPYRHNYYAQPNPYSIPETAWEALYADHRRGLTPQELAGKWGVSPLTIRRTLRRYEHSMPEIISLADGNLFDLMNQVTTDPREPPASSLIAVYEGGCWFDMTQLG